LSVEKPFYQRQKTDTFGCIESPKPKHYLSFILILHFMKKLVSLLCFLSWAFVSLGQNSDKPYVVMVSFDGFRHDYVQKYPVKHIKNFIKKGAAEVMLPSYPSKTFPIIIL
jgi:predicted AlkP superfamily pyrophosphatase or phosphodiesterase